MTPGAIAYGAMRLSFEGRPEAGDAIRLIRLAADLGARLVDTSPAYCRLPEERGHNERLVARALGGRSDILVATKAGQLRTSPKGFTIDARPKVLRESVETSLRDLGVDAIDLCLLHWPDPAVPYAESVGALADLRHEGLIRDVGVSNVDAGQLTTALDVVPVACVQNRLSPLATAAELAVVDACATAGVPFVAYWLLGGRKGLAELVAARPELVQVAARQGVSVHRLVVAWALTVPRVVPLVGAREEAHLRDSFAAGDLALSPEALRALASPPPPP